MDRDRIRVCHFFVLNEVASIAFEGPHGAQIISLRRWQALLEQVLLALGDWHEQQPQSPGPDEQSLALSFEHAVPRDLFRTLVDDLINSGKMMRDGG